MKAPICTVVERVEILSQKINLFGITEILWADTVPAVISFRLFLMLDFDASDANRQALLKVRLIDQDGICLHDTSEDVPLAIPSIPVDAPLLTKKFPLTITYENTLFPRWGTYRFDVYVDGEILADCQVSVCKPE